MIGPSTTSKSAASTALAEEDSTAGWLLALLRRRFGRELGEDLRQETLLRLQSQGPDDIRSPRALMMKVAASAAIESARVAPPP